MSQPAGKKGGAKGQKNNDKDDSKESSKKDTPSKDKDESGSNGDGPSEAAPGPSKPQSAGASIRDAAQRIMSLTSKGEWSPIEQILKQIERALAVVTASGEDVNTNPLAGVADPVIICL